MNIQSLGIILVIHLPCWDVLHWLVGSIIWLTKRFPFTTLATMSEPLEFLEQSIGQPLWIISKNDIEYSGKFEGFDESLNMVLSDMIVHGPKDARSHHSKALIRRDQIDIVIPGANES